MKSYEYYHRHYNHDSDYGIIKCRFKHMANLQKKMKLCKISKLIHAAYLKGYFAVKRRLFGKFHKVCLYEIVDFTIHHTVDIGSLEVGAVVFYAAVIKHVAADL